MPEEAVTVAELAKLLDVHPQTVYSKANAGAIPGIRVGRAWRFFPSQVTAALQAASDPWVQASKPRGIRTK